MCRENKNLSSHVKSLHQSVKGQMMNLSRISRILSGQLGSPSVHLPLGMFDTVGSQFYFVKFQTEDAVESALEEPTQVINDHQVVVRRAIPNNNQPESAHELDNPVGNGDDREHGGRRGGRGGRGGRHGHSGRYPVREFNWR